MAYELLQCGNTQYAVDWTVIERLLRSYWTAKLQNAFANEFVISDSHWYNPMSWSLPDVSNVEVDWHAVRKQSTEYAKLDVSELRYAATSDARSVAWLIASRIEEAAQLNEQFAEQLRQVQRRNFQSINKAVSDYEAHAEVARVVRDLSAEGLMVGASVMGAGVIGTDAVVTLGTGSILKGYAKFQDSGSIGAGVMEGFGSFVFAFVKLGRTFSLKQDLALAIVQAPYKAGTEFVGGASFGNAVVSGDLKITGPFVERLFKMGMVKTFFQKLAVPIVIKYGSKNITADQLSKWVGKGVQKIGVEKYGKHWINESSSTSETRAEPVVKRSPLIDQATLTNRMLLNLSFVNMVNGIGRGW